MDPNLSVVREYEDAAGNKKVDGARDLKGTQEYTLDFGRAVQLVYQRHASDIKADETDNNNTYYHYDTW